jgi:perosamine synthetase
VSAGLRRALPDVPRARYTVFCGTAGGAEIRAALDAVLSGDLHDERVVRDYEADLAARCGRRHAITFGAGRMAHWAALRAAGLPEGGEVLVPAFTCVAVANAILYAGLRPRWVDVDPVTFNLDPKAAADALSGNTVAVHMQHTFGVSADVNGLRALADQHGLLLVEDAAHSLGAGHEGRPHGSLGDVSFVSTDRTKVIGTHLGGAALTDDDGMASRLAALQAEAPALRRGLARRLALSYLEEAVLFHPGLLWLGRPVVGALRRLGLHRVLSDEDRAERPHDLPYGWPHRLPSGQARIGRLQLARLDEQLAHRRTIARMVDGHVRHYGARLGETFDHQAWLRASFLVRDRAAFEARLASRFQLGTWFTEPIFGRPQDTEAVGFHPGSCPVAEHAAEHVVNLPTHPRVPLHAIEAVFAEHGGAIARDLLPAGGRSA